MDWRALIKMLGIALVSWCIVLLIMFVIFSHGGDGVYHAI